MPRIAQAAAAVKTPANEIVGFARMVRAMFRRHRSPGDPDDIEQQAALEVLLTEQRSGLPIAGNRRYHYRAASTSAGLMVSRARSAVTIWEKLSHRASEWSDRTPIVGCGHEAGPGVVDVDGGRMPDASVCARELAEARHALMEVVAWHVRQLSYRDRRALEVMLGIGTDPADDQAEASWRTGLSSGYVGNAVRRLAARIAADERARNLRRAMLDHLAEQP